MKKKLTSEHRAELLAVLKSRFEKNMNRHKGLKWPDIQTKLEASAEKMWSLSEMESTGGEPDVVAFDKKTGEVFVMTAKRWKQERHINQKTTRWMSRQPWE